MCQLPWYLRASSSWNPQGLSRPVMGLLYLSPSPKFNAIHKVRVSQLFDQWTLFTPNIFSTITPFFLTYKTMHHFTCIKKKCQVTVRITGHTRIVRKLLHVTLLAPRIWRWQLNFWKIFEPMQEVVLMLLVKNTEVGRHDDTNNEYVHFKCFKRSR